MKTKTKTMSKLAKIADELDRLGLYSLASRLDNINWDEEDDDDEDDLSEAVYSAWYYIDVLINNSKHKRTKTYFEYLHIPRKDIDMTVKLVGEDIYEQIMEADIDEFPAIAAKLVTPAKDLLREFMGRIVRSDLRQDPEVFLELAKKTRDIFGEIKGAFGEL